MSGVDEWIERVLHMGRLWQERVVFLLAFLGIAYGTWAIVDLLAEAWASEGITGLFTDVFVAVGLSRLHLLVLVVGVFTGIIGTMIFDSYKRIMGLLVVLWTGIWTIVNPNVPVGGFLLALSPGLVALGLSIAVGTAVALGVRWRDLKRRRAPFKFGWAPRTLAVFTFLAVLVALPDAHLAYRDVTVCGIGGMSCVTMQFRPTPTGSTVAAHLTGGVVLVATTIAFTRYEGDTRVMVLGPQRSGKSAALGGMALTAEYWSLRERRTLNLRGFIYTIVDEYLLAGKWPVPNRPGQDETKLLRFNYPYGWFFPKDLAIQTVDYPGDLLEEIVAPLVADEVRYDSGSGDPETEETTVNDLFSVGGDDVNQTSTNRGAEGDDEEAPPDFSEIFGEESDIKDDVQPTRRENIEGWNDAIDLLQEYPPKEKARPALRACIQDADTLVLTIPLDDFIKRAVENDTLPPYMENAVETDEEGDPVQRSDGRYRLKKARDVDRMGRSEYLKLYTQLTQTFPDTQFVLMVTMADYAKWDYTDAPTDLRLVGEEYRDFRTHIEEEFLTSSVKRLKQRADERNVYPVWFNIAYEEREDGTYEMRPESTDNRPLRGARKLLNRIAS
jgi:hypothetical protein